MPDEYGLDEINNARKKIFEEVMEENKSGYAKTYGIGVKVPRSRKKRCALTEEQSKQVRLEEDVIRLTVGLKNAQDQISCLVDAIHKLAGKKPLRYEDYEDEIDNEDDEEVEDGAEEEEEVGEEEEYY